MGKKAYVGVLTLWTVGIKYEQSSMQTVFQCFFLFFFAGKDETVRYKWKLNVWQTPFAAPADKELNMFFSFSVISFGIIYRLYELLLYLICPFFPHLVSSESILMLTQGDSQQRFLRELYSRDKCEYKRVFNLETDIQGENKISSHLPAASSRIQWVDLEAVGKKRL